MPITHTPAPWKAHFEEAYYVTGPDLGRVAMMMHLKGPHGMGGRRSGDEAAANCRLISSAPALLAALKALYYRFPCYDDLKFAGWTQERIEKAEAEMDAARKALIEAGAIKYETTTQGETK
jgi:hypothetical protein